MTRLDELVAEGVARPNRKRRSRWLLPAFIVFLLLLVSLFVLRDMLLAAAGDFLVVSDPLNHADLIYVFAGDFWGSRVLAGAELAAEGWAPTVILSGGRYQDHCACELSVDFAVDSGFPRSLFVSVPFNAVSTIDEARAMGPIFQRFGAKRIILVTSNFHSRRAAQVFRAYLPEFEFLMEAAPDNTFDPHAWWTKPAQRHLVFGEYQKMIGTVLVRRHLATPQSLRQVEQ